MHDCKLFITFHKRDFSRYHAQFYDFFFLVFVFLLSLAISRVGCLALRDFRGVVFSACSSVSSFSASAVFLVSTNCDFAVPLSVSFLRRDSLASLADELTSRFSLASCLSVRRLRRFLVFFGLVLETENKSYRILYSG